MSKREAELIFSRSAFLLLLDNLIPSCSTSLISASSLFEFINASSCISLLDILNNLVQSFLAFKGFVSWKRLARNSFISHAEQGICRMVLSALYFFIVNYWRNNRLPFLCLSFNYMNSEFTKSFLNILFEYEWEEYLLLFFARDSFDLLFDEIDLVWVLLSDSSISQTVMGHWRTFKNLSICFPI